MALGDLAYWEKVLHGVNLWRKLCRNKEFMPHLHQENFSLALFIDLTTLIILDNL